MVTVTTGMVTNRGQKSADTLRAAVHGTLFYAIATTTSALAQSPPEGSPPPAPTDRRVSSLPGVAGPAWLFVPRIGITASATDNAAQSIDALAKRDLVTELTPGFRLQNIGARSSILLDWQVRYVRYLDESRLNNSSTQLNAQFNFQPIEKFAFVDSLATISQQNRSPFADALANGGLTPDENQNNRVDTKTFRISPYVRGHVGDIARYQIRYNETEVRTDDNAIPSTRLLELVGKISNASPGAKIGWSGEFNLLQLRNATVERLNDNRVRGTLFYALTDQFHLTGTFGRDATDFAADTRRSNNIYGAGFEWSPSTRTQVAALREHRFFGEGYVMQLSHRTPRTSWRASATRDVTALPQQLAAVDPGSVYGVFYDLLASAVPDPTLRADAARSRLQQAGIAPNAALTGGFLTTRPYLATSRDLTVALLGIRNTITMTYRLRDQVSTGPTTVRGNPLATNEDIRQEAINVAWAYRLTPLMTMTLQSSLLETNGLTTTSDSSRQKLRSFMLARPLSPKATVSLGWRGTVFTSTVTRSYSENVLFGTLNYRF